MNLNKELFKYLQLKSFSFGISDDDFLNMNYSISDLNDKMGLISNDDIIKNTLDFFHAVASHIPAYRQHLLSHHVSPEDITDIQAFIDLVPPITKENYLKRNSLKDLCWGGKISLASTIASSSGSSGNISFWPRHFIDEIETAIYHELVLEENFHISKKSTLAVSTYALGIYTGGIYTVNSLNRINSRGIHLTSITPGMHISDIITALKPLMPLFEQIIFIGYPPFIKDLLEKGIELFSIDWSDFDIKLLLSSESYTDGFANYLCHLMGNNALPGANIANLYACSDAAVIGYSTPALYPLRNEIYNLDKHASGHTESLYKYNPLNVRFDLAEKGYYLTKNNFVPLIKYEMQDGINIVNKTDLKNTHLISLEGREDVTESLYGVKIKPDHLKSILDEVEYREYLSGRYILSKFVSQDSFQQSLNIFFELKTHSTLDQIDMSAFRHKVFEILFKNNKELNRLAEAIDIQSATKIEILPYNTGAFQDKLSSIKNRYVR